MEDQEANHDYLGASVQICKDSLVDQHEYHVGEQTELLREVGTDECDDTVDNGEDDEVRGDNTVNTDEITPPVVAKRHRRPPRNGSMINMSIEV